MPSKLIAWVSLLACAAGCASSSPPNGVGDGEPARSLSSPIIGGHLDTATQGVVALLVQGNDQLQVFCTGTLIAPNLVLTARHCIAQIGDGLGEVVDCARSQFTVPYDASSFFISADAEPKTSLGALYSVRQVLEAPGGSDVCGLDVALLILSGAGIPSASATPLVPELSARTVVRSAFSAVGYGLQNATDTLGTTAGNRMRFDNAQVYCVGPGCPAAAQNQADEWVGNSPVCSGDSGGPALDSQGRVFGVASRGDANCSYALYSDVANWADFIRGTAQLAATAGGYPAPSWADTGIGGPLTDGGPNVGDAGGARDAGAAAPDAGINAGGGGDGVADAGTASTPPPAIGSAPTVNPLGQACAGDCPGTYRCFSATGAPPGVCVPPCGQSAAPCPTNYGCSDSLQVCVPIENLEGKGRASCAFGVQVDASSDSMQGPLAMLFLGCAWRVRRRRSSRCAA